MKIRLALLGWVLAITVQAQQHVPTFEEVISLRGPGQVALAPDGKTVAFSVNTTDWNENRFDSEIWLSREGQAPIQITNTAKGSSNGPAFSPDGNWLTFLADRGSKTQVYAVRLSGGEAIAITHEEDGVLAYEWFPDGKRLLLLKSEKEDPAKKEREKRYGGFEADDREFSLAHLWQIDFVTDGRDPSELPCYESSDSLRRKAGCIEWAKASRLTSGKFTVTDFVTSPDGTKVAFSHQPDPLINSSMRSDISFLEIATQKITPLVTNAGSDGLEDWSPDSNEILFTTYLNDTLSHFYKNPQLYAMQIANRTTRRLAAGLDENVGGLTWRPTGIFGAVFQKTNRPIYRIDPTSGSFQVWSKSPDQTGGVALNRAGTHLACTGRQHNGLNEVFQSAVDNPSLVQRTHFGDQVKNWRLASSEVVSWKSKDGATIEGILHKPADYDPSKKYPLLVVIHGGPTGIDTPNPIPSGVYPMLQWLSKGCLVLRPNYRGSAGYGEAFRSLNVRNLGVGDAWDVLSGVEYLNSKGLIDTSKMGCMGWSQGGYISAFLTTNSDVFKAISVGAGISDWMTYYVNTDIHPFTRQYLKATPWNDPEIYKKTSPMTNINKAKTPTLIQHGEFDRRVPIANAYELLQGLRDRRIPAELIVYKGFGHGITKPKERLAANWHNWQWFNKYIWGEEVQIPLGLKEKK